VGRRWFCHPPPPHNIIIYLCIKILLFRLLEKVKKKKSVWAHGLREEKILIGLTKIFLAIIKQLIWLVFTLFEKINLILLTI
jgi:hypothetical protein